MTATTHTEAAARLKAAYAACNIAWDRKIGLLPTHRLVELAEHWELRARQASLPDSYFEPERNHDGVFRPYYGARLPVEHDRAYHGRLWACGD